MEYPCCPKLVNIGSIDFMQTGVAASRIVAIVGGPIVTGWLGHEVLFAHDGEPGRRRLASLPCRWQSGQSAGGGRRHQHYPPRRFHLSDSPRYPLGLPEENHGRSHLHLPGEGKHALPIEE